MGATQRSEPTDCTVFLDSGACCTPVGGFEHAPSTGSGNRHSLHYWSCHGSICHALVEVGSMEVPALRREVRSAQGPHGESHRLFSLLETDI